MGNLVRGLLLTTWVFRPTRGTNAVTLQLSTLLYSAQRIAILLPSAVLGIRYPDNPPSPGKPPRDFFQPSDDYLNIKTCSIHVHHFRVRARNRLGFPRLNIRTQGEMSRRGISGGNDLHPVTECPYQISRRKATRLHSPNRPPGITCHIQARWLPVLFIISPSRLRSKAASDALLEQIAAK